VSIRNCADIIAEPAVHSRAQTAEDNTLLPGAAEDVVKPVHAPDGGQVGRIAATHVDHVLREDERLQVEDRAMEQLKIGGLAVKRRERPVEPGDVINRIAACGRKEAHARTRRSRQRQNELVKQPVLRFHREPAAAHRHHRHGLA
jgi:hypothetical protein